jgi:beta-N-acetylhexosaminidase
MISPALVPGAAGSLMVAALFAAGAAAKTGGDYRAPLFPAVSPLATRGAMEAPRPPLTPVPGGRHSVEDATLRAMIGQMILIGFPGTRPDGEWPGLVAGMIRDSRIGGVILFGDNVADPAQVKALNGKLAAAGGTGLPPFICVDQEGGKIQRLTRAKGFVGLPGAAAIAAKDEESAYRKYLASASELADLGFNVNFGPVLDLNINPANPAIGALRRSYGRDAAKATGFGRQFVRAHRRSGVLVTVKHFPGHGSAPTDPHERIVDIGAVWKPEELEPFKALIDENRVDLVMVGHLIHPRFSDAGDVPASLSAKAIRSELRGILGYEGLVVTDDLEMSAVRKRYSLEEAAVMAVAAGADLLIIANQQQPDRDVVGRVTSAIARAVAEDRIPRARIGEAYARIAAVKRKLKERVPDGWHPQRDAMRWEPSGIPSRPYFGGIRAGYDRPAAGKTGLSKP